MMIKRNFFSECFSFRHNHMLMVTDYRERWKLTSLSSSAGVRLPLALRSTV